MHTADATTVTPPRAHWNTLRCSWPIGLGVGAHHCTPCGRVPVPFPRPPLLATEPPTYRPRGKKTCSAPSPPRPCQLLERQTATPHAKALKAPAAFGHYPAPYSDGRTDGVTAAEMT